MQVIRFHAITPSAILMAAILHVRAAWRRCEIESSADVADAIAIMDRLRNELNRAE